MQNCFRKSYIKVFKKIRSNQGYVFTLVTWEVIYIHDLDCSYSIMCKTTKLINFQAFSSPVCTSALPPSTSWARQSSTSRASSSWSWQSRGTTTSGTASTWNKEKHGLGQRINRYIVVYSFWESCFPSNKVFLCSMSPEEWDSTSLVKVIWLSGTKITGTEITGSRLQRLRL